MPFHLRSDGKPVVAFDPRLEISPFALFRRLDEGREMLLVDVRAPSSVGRTLRGAQQLPDMAWKPPETAARLIDAGHPRVRALFGGLELYEFSLDPEVVGAETYLVTDAG
jgi:hypothetical protein